MYRIVNRKFAPGTERPELVFGETPVLEFTLPSPHEEGDSYALSVDDDMCFGCGSDGRLMAYSNSGRLSPDSLSVSFALDCATPKFAERTNCRQSIPAWMQLTRIKADGSVDNLLIDRAIASSVVYGGKGVPPCPVPDPPQGGRVTWPDGIENLPETFPPSPHTQGMETIAGLPETVAEINRRIDEERDRKTDYGELLNVPTEFNPAPHSQAIGTIVGLASRLSELAEGVRQALARVVSYGELADVPSEFPPAPHTQGIDTVVGLSARLEGLSSAIADSVSGLDGRVPPAGPDGSVLVKSGAGGAWSPRYDADGTTVVRRGNSFSVGEIPMDKVTGLEESVGSKLTAPEGGETGDGIFLNPDMGVMWKSPYVVYPETLSGDSVTVRQGRCYEWTADGPCVLNADGWDAEGEVWSTVYIRVMRGASVTGGSGLTMVNRLFPGMMNYCQLKGFKGKVRLYVLEAYEA